MVDNKIILPHNTEMAEHAYGATHHLGALLAGRYVKKEQTSDIVDFLFAGTKRNIESSSFATQEEKDAETHRRELLPNTMKLLMGL